jgi:hypothetical protein
LNSSYNFSVSGLDDGNKTFGIKLEDPSPPSVDCTVNVTWLNSSSPLFDTNTSTISTGGFTTFGFNYSIKDMVKMDLINASSLQLFGRIWLFDTGSITYDLISSIGRFKVVIENLGIVVYSPGGPFLRDWPVIYNTTNFLAMRILSVRGYQGGAGAGTYRFLIRVNKDACTEINRDVYYFKLQIYGDYSTVWKEYFKTQHGFGEYTDDTLYGSNERFSLVYSLCNVDLRMMG